MPYNDFRRLYFGIVSGKKNKRKCITIFFCGMCGVYNLYRFITLTNMKNYNRRSSNFPPFPREFVDRTNLVRFYEEEAQEVFSPLNIHGAGKLHCSHPESFLLRIHHTAMHATERHFHEFFASIRKQIV